MSTGFTKIKMFMSMFKAVKKAIYFLKNEDTFFFFERDKDTFIKPC